MKSIFVKCLVPAMLLGTIAIPIAARADADDHGVNARLHRQHERIHQGVVSGELTQREAHRLNNREHRLYHKESWDRRHDNGNLTTRERRHLEQGENRDSHAIWRQKHDDQTR